MVFPFGDWLSNQLSSKNRSQADLWRYLHAVQLGVTRANISDYCRGTVRPPTDKLNAICDFLELDSAGRSEALRVASLSRSSAA